ncbi:MAG: histidinol-phosphate transaminase [Oscillospiraceae bacterium]|nr:histidinol-phosphate transaminase [Oscillospiraceae bacterium]MBQ7330169.1 histidinol-phosphate transaminase [Oscillospiraceae bacterium]
MSKFFTEKFAALEPYTPGEQPRDMQYVKLNTNESPFPPSAGVAEAVAKECSKLQLYSDPESTALRKRLAEVYGVKPSQVLVSNGSDEALNFAFMAFADEKSPLAFPDITYGFYPVFAQLNHIPYTQIPLKEDFSIDPADYMAIHKTVVIANPNAPTGMCLPLQDIEDILKSNPGNVVIVDEAYVDFGGESAVKLVEHYENLLVVQTFSKSRSMAGARLGFAIGNEKLIADLNTIRYSTNPYNVNRMTEFAGVAALEENDYYLQNAKTIMANRAWTVSELQKLGFTVLDSKANFVFAKSDKIDGEKLYKELKARGVLVRHFTKARISPYVRITIGTLQQMETLIEKIKEILGA